MVNKKRYYVAIAGNGTTSGYVWLTDEQYAFLNNIMDVRNWEDVKQDAEESKFYLGRE